LISLLKFLLHLKSKNDDWRLNLYMGRNHLLDLKLQAGRLPEVSTRHSTHQTPIVPPARSRYLAEISDTVRGYKKRARAQARLAREIQQLQASQDMLSQAGCEVAQGLQALEQPALNEYDSHALIEAIHPEPLARPDTPELYRHHFRLLRQALQAWIAGQIAPRGMPSFEQWSAGIRAALDHVRQNHQGVVLLVSSGGPIATAVGQIIDASPTSWIELNLRIRNASITQFEFNPKRHSLLTYNTLPHLDGPAYEDWISYT
jgi:broad specificity phosphatase PhoE